MDGPGQTRLVGGSWREGGHWAPGSHSALAVLPARDLGVCLCADDKVESGEEKDPAVVTQSDEGPTEEDHLGPNCYYDKSKSFFDNISSELKTRWVGTCSSEDHTELLSSGLVSQGPAHVFA